MSGQCECHAGCQPQVTHDLMTGCTEPAAVVWVIAGDPHPGSGKPGLSSLTAVPDRPTRLCAACRARWEAAGARPARLESL